MPHHQLSTVDSGAPAEPITAVCAATYYADLVAGYAFVFAVPSTRKQT